MSQQLAPPPPQTRRHRMVAPVLTIGGLAAATLALHLRDPHQGGWGQCPTAALGFACPGCGGLRAVNDLTHLDVAAAASSNLALVIAIPFVVIALSLWAVRSWRGEEVAIDWRRRQRATVVLLVVLGIFTVLRNLPLGSWLAP